MKRKPEEEIVFLNITLKHYVIVKFHKRFHSLANILHVETAINYVNLIKLGNEIM